MDKQRQDDQLEPTAQIRDVDLKTCWKQWMIRKGGKMLMERHDDDDEFYVHMTSVNVQIIMVKKTKLKFSMHRIKKNVISNFSFSGSNLG